VKLKEIIFFAFACEFNICLTHPAPIQHKDDKNKNRFYGNKYLIIYRKVILKNRQYMYLAVFGNMIYVSLSIVILKTNHR
jgi:hypothetical protein